MKAELGRTVPTRRDVVRVRRAGPDLPRQAEVRQLDAVARHEDVLRLHVAVEEAVLVHVG